MRTALLKRLRHPDCTGRGLRRERVAPDRSVPCAPPAVAQRPASQVQMSVLQKADTEGISDTYYMRTRVELCGNVQQRGLILTWFENRACLVHRRLGRPPLPVRPAWRPVRTARQRTATARGPFRRPAPALPPPCSPVKRRVEARPKPASDVAVNPCQPCHRRIDTHSAPGAPETHRLWPHYAVRRLGGDRTAGPCTRPGHHRALATPDETPRHRSPRGTRTHFSRCPPPPLASPARRQAM